jgi:hypothetical protein
MTIELSPELERIIEEAVVSGQYPCAADVLDRLKAGEQALAPAFWPLEVPRSSMPEQLTQHMQQKGITRTPSCRRCYQRMNRRSLRVHLHENPATESDLRLYC